MRYLSNSARCTRSVFFILVISFCCLVFPVTLVAEVNAGTNPPAIDLDGWGAVFWRHNSMDVTSLRVKVIDHDGISHDGSSHQVSATCNGEFFPLTYFYSDSAYEAYYEYWDDGTAPAGDYVFIVTDPDGHSATAIDTLVVNPLQTADQTGFHLTANGTSPTIAWDPVPDASRYQFRIRDMNWNHVWNGFPRTTDRLSYTIPPGVLAPNTQYSFNIRARDHHYPVEIDNMSTGENVFFTTGETSEKPLIEIDIGSGAVRNPLIDIVSVGAATRTTEDPDSGDTITHLFFRVKIHDAQGVPGNIQSVTATFPDGTTIPLELDYNESDTCGIYYAEDFSLPIAAVEYAITVTDLEGNTHSVTDTLDVNPIGHPADNTVTAGVNGTRVDVAWEQIDGATSYRLEIYDMKGDLLHRLGTTENTYTIPAGYLKESTSYQYHIKAFRELFEQGVDNSSRSVMKTFQTGSNQDDATPEILTADNPDITISGGRSTVVYGTSTPNEITLESGAKAELIHFPGSNLIIFQSDATLFTVSRSGTVVTFQGADGTLLKIPATIDEQTLVFDNADPLILRIHENQVKLNDQVIDTSPSLISLDNHSGCGAYVAPDVWKEFDCYNLAAIGKTTNDDPFTPSWRLIGGYWQWGRKGPDSSEWYDTNTEHFAHGPTGPDADAANEGEISGWDSSYGPDGAWSDIEKTVNDPCPTGYRVPSISQWNGVLNNNTQSIVGTWSNNTTNYSSARSFGAKLMLPAAGGRDYTNTGTLYNRGNFGFYWSSSEFIDEKARDLYFRSEHVGMAEYNRTDGCSIRCVAE